MSVEYGNYLLLINNFENFYLRPKFDSFLPNKPTQKVKFRGENCFKMNFLYTYWNFWFVSCSLLMLKLCIFAKILIYLEQAKQLENLMK
jgi:hypothetical protein